MQCVSCQFENMPGTQYCGRCGARLELASATVDVHPPRAGPWEKRFRRWLSRSWLLDRSRIAVLEACGALSIGLSPALFLRITVPGWPQMTAGRLLAGRIFFWGYLASLLLGLLFAGTFPGGVMLGLALSLHASSVLDVVFWAISETPLRVGYSLLGILLVALILYLPAGWLITRVAVPRRIVLTTPPFERGDVVLYNPSAYRRSPPQLGDVVLYEIPGGQVPGLDGARDPGRLQRRAPGGSTGLSAGAGQKVECASGRIQIDGRLSDWRPLNPKRLPAGLSLTVPSDQYLILPTTNPQEFVEVATTQWRRVSLVPKRNLYGKVYLRHQPLWRLWRIR